MFACLDCASLTRHTDGLLNLTSGVHRFDWLVREEEVNSACCGEHLLPDLVFLRVQQSSIPEADEVAALVHLIYNLFSQELQQDVDALCLIEDRVVCRIWQAHPVPQTLNDKRSV